MWQVNKLVSGLQIHGFGYRKKQIVILKEKLLWREKSELRIRNSVVYYK